MQYQNNHHLYVESRKGLMREGKAGSNKNNADIRGQSESYQQSLTNTRTPGKSRNKGKGKQKNREDWKEFLENPDSVISTTQL